jgi:hypothetical protein
MSAIASIIPLGAAAAARHHARMDALPARALLALALLAGSAAAEPAVTAARATQVLFGDAPVPPACAAGTDAERVRCLVVSRYAGAHPASARRGALALLDELGDVAGSEVEQDMDGGYRGKIHLVPALPIGGAAEHLGYVLGAQRELARVLGALEARAGAPLPYRHRALVFRFFRSVRKRTPSAYAVEWEVGYNLAGSLNRSVESVRDVLFHEIFHLNDAAHGGWSHRALGELVAGVAERCGGTPACLTPFAPMAMTVRATGVYYAFQKDNGDMANEYAAELATRYLLEQRAALRGERPPAGRFKCRNETNARAWRALAQEFFAGVDLTPPCS